MARREPGELEREVLACLAAEGGPMSPGDVQQALGGGLAYTTVMTTLSRMHAKRALLREQQGRGFVYTLPDTPDTAQASMAAYQMQRLLDRGQDRADVLTHFVANLDSDDERLLQRLLSDRPGDTGSGRTRRRRAT